jgi:hypothetical protein
MNWTNRHSCLAGLGLIALVNAIALLGVAWNRNGVADSQLQLSERELGPAYSYASRENSGVALQLEYRWPNDDGEYNGQLSSAKMQELGFNVPADLSEANVRRYVRQLDRDGLVVLEFNGPLYQRELQLAQEKLRSSAADLAALPANKPLAETHERARLALHREQVSASRLLVADVGLDQQVLRARYPDRNRYAIVRGRFNVWSWHDDDSVQLGGSAQIPVAQSINLAHRWHALFSQLPSSQKVAEFPDEGSRNLFNVDLAFGQRLEPWIVQLQAGQP